jgi:predicted O-linked N-acetylglucosamine transferase (SPINDLY family)
MTPVHKGAAQLLEEGLSLERNQLVAEALSKYEAAIDLLPEFAQAHFQRGNLLLEKGEYTSAVDAYATAIRLKPISASTHFNMGNAYAALGRYVEASNAFRQAIRLKPDFADAELALGSAQEELGQLSAAVDCYRRALMIDPNYAEAHYNLGLTLKELGKLTLAVESFQRAVEIKSAFFSAHNCLLFIHNYLNDRATSVMLNEARQFGFLVARHSTPATQWGNPPQIFRTLRIGLVSGDLRNHPVGYFLESVLTAMAANMTKLSVHAYPTYSCDDNTGARLKSHCASWCSVVGLSDEQLANRIREDKIDILIDLAGHTANNRLAMFAWKPAPVQVSWLGYFATTGVAAIDYFIADPWTLPPCEEQYFTEKIWRLPETRLCFTPPDVDVPVSTLPALSNGYVTFGCFNNLSKMNDAVVALWARILHAIPNSRLFLKAGQIGVTTVRQSIHARFAAHGIEAERLILEDFVPRAEYLAAYHKVDIALDPFPYTGGTTTVEALWMGVPVLTLAGERFLSRQGVGLLMNAGLSEWVATDPEDYVTRARSHANHLPNLSALRAGLRQQVLTSPIFDAPRFAQHFEAALRGMWRTWCEQQAGLQAHIEQTDDGTI